MLGEIIGGIGSLLGGIFGESGKSKEIKAQKEFAQQGIRWRVEDANAAGIHPLYALGANTTSYQPVGVGESMAAGLSNAGQSFGRAIEAKQTVPERGFNQRMMALQLQRGELENQLLASQIARNNQAGQPPALPTTSAPNAALTPYLLDGQGQSLVQVNPMERVASNPGTPYQEPAAVSDRSFAQTVDGGLAPVYSTDVKQRLEDDPLGSLGWNVRNRIVPTLGKLVPPYPAPEGKVWTFDGIDQSYKLIDIDKNPRNTKFYR